MVFMALALSVVFAQSPYLDYTKISDEPSAHRLQIAKDSDAVAEPSVRHICGIDIPLSDHIRIFGFAPNPIVPMPPLPYSRAVAIAYTELDNFKNSLLENGFDINDYFIYHYHIEDAYPNDLYSHMLVYRDSLDERMANMYLQLAAEPKITFASDAADFGDVNEVGTKSTAHRESILAQFTEDEIAAANPLMIEALSISLRLNYAANEAYADFLLENGYICC